MWRSAQSEMGEERDGRRSGSGVSSTEETVASKVQLEGFCCFLPFFFSVCTRKSLCFPPNESQVMLNPEFGFDRISHVHPVWVRTDRNVTDSDDHTPPNSCHTSNCVSVRLCQRVT